MERNVLARKILFFILGICAGGMLVYTMLAEFRGHPQTDLMVDFLDIGQGDAVLIESPSGTKVLVDGGPDGTVLKRLGETLGYFDRDIDLVVATHPDMDHIGGLIDVFDRYHVHDVLLTENESQTAASAAFRERVKASGAHVYYARAGQVYDLGLGQNGSTTLAVLFPDRDPTKLESNTSSIVAQVRYGKTAFMLTGDSPQPIEEYLVSVYGSRLLSDVLKAGHHGSHTSSSEVFVTTVHPTYAVISAGKNNKYGHPHQEVLDLFKRLGIMVRSTLGQGTVECTSDGSVVKC